MALPLRAPAAASESSSSAKLASSVAARALIMVSVSGSTSVGSGTTSTTYTSSRGSVLSSEPGLASQLQCIDDEEKEKRLDEHAEAKRLLKELCHGDGDIGALERWLSEMGVGWFLDIAADPYAGTILLLAQHQRDNLTERWIAALTEIMESTNLKHTMSGTDVPGRRVQLLGIFKATVLKMLPFVDALLAAADLDATTDTAGVSNGVQVPSEKLQALLAVRDALSSASQGIQYCDSSVEMEAHQRSCDEVLRLLSAKEHGLDKAIWNTIQEVRTSILSDGDDNNEWGIQTSQGSANICKGTRSLMTCIKSLWNNYLRLNDIVRAAAAAEHGSYVPNRDIRSTPSVLKYFSLTLEMVSSLEVKLAKRSEYFRDHSLKFLFLINNTHFIRQHLDPLFRMNKYLIAVLTHKIENYIQKYLQASWAPVMSCLYNHTPRWFRKNTALPKFDLEFQKTYTAQKLWKVPDPELRTRLRKAIIKEVVPGLTKYLEDNNITSPEVSPQEREEMLLELFEG